MKRFLMVAFLTFFGMLFFNAPAFGQCVSLTTLGSAYTQNFDTLSNTAGSTTNNLTIPGWFLTESGGGARDNEQYAVDTGASTTGDMFSYGAAGSTERALGQLRSGTLIPLFGACFTNNTGATINSTAIAYTGEEWRLGTAGRTDQMNFEYSTNATDLVTGTWTNVAALNFVTPDTVTTGAKDGNSAADRTNLSSTINSLSIPNGATFWIRFNDTDASGADDGLAVDNFSLTPNSAPLVPNLSVNDVSLPEGNSGMTNFNFTVSLSSPAPAGGVTFDIAASNGTATTADNDYVPISLTSVTIPQGDSSYLFTVAVNGDTTFETGETFFVNVTNVTGATVIDGQGLGIIQNDDALPTFSIDDVTMNEGNGGTTNFVFTVTKTGQTSLPASVQADTANGSASSGTDYTANSQILTFLPNETTKSFTVAVTGDTDIETDEDFFVNLSANVGANILDGQGVGLIVNDDLAPPTVSIENGFYTEDESQTLRINVFRSGDLSGTTTVQYSTQAPQNLGSSPATGGASCTGGVDYVEQNGTLTFNPGDDLAQILIPICTDLQTEPNEQFPVILSNVTGGTLGETPVAQVTVNDTASQYRNADEIGIGFGNEGNPYPATISVTGATTNIGSMRVTLYDFQHIGADRVDILLVGPQGQKMLLMADAGGSNGLILPATITFDDSAGQVLPDNAVINTGRYEPTTWEPGQSSFSAPAPAGPYSEPGSTVGGAVTLASVFGGTNANGNWSLYIRDDNNTFQPLGLGGQITGGWGLQFLAPTAAGVSVSGQVRSGNTGIRNTTVMITGGNLTQPLITRTNSFGNYTFEGLTAGQTYIVTVVSYRYSFPQTSIVLNVDDNISNADFEAEER